MSDAVPDFHQLHPPAIVQEVRSRRRKRSARQRRQRENSQRQRRDTDLRNTALFVGAVVILQDDYGRPYECEITQIASDGRWWCLPR